MSKLSFVRIAGDHSHIHDLAQEGEKNKTLYRGEIKKMNIDTPVMKSVILQGYVEKLSDKEAAELLSAEVSTDQETEITETGGEGGGETKTPKTPKK